MILVDTTGLIGGTLGQILKFHKLEALRPDWVIGFQRGEELEPILGIVRRTMPVEVECLPIPDGVRITNVDERIANRREKLKAAFEPPVHRWKVKSSVFLPQLPPDVDPAKLDGLLVGMEDGKGTCMGLGILEYREDGLKMISTVAEGAKALRVGSTQGDGRFRHASDRSPGAVRLGLGFLLASATSPTKEKMGSIIKKRRKKMRKHKHKKLLKKTRWQRRQKT